MIRLWQDVQEVLPGVTLHRCGGHFAGSTVLHWPDGADGRGILFTGDTMFVGSDRIAETVGPLAFDRLYSRFEPGSISSSASEAVQYSANRYIGWLNDELRDPDDRF